MDTRTISMGGAAWLASSIASKKKADFIKDELKGYAFIDKNKDVRETLLAQVYDIAVKRYPDLFKKK